MAEESFMLISLKEKQSKELAQTISNETCRSILDYLANQEYATETQVSKDLGIPLSTAHYNLKMLARSKLVTTDEFHYSGKGKEVPHYKLANKFIIIAPKEEKKLMEKIRRFFPVTAIALGVAAALELGQRVLGHARTPDTLLAGGMELAPRAVAKAANETPELLLTAADAAMDAAPMMVDKAARTPFPTPIAMWFLGGALFVILTLVVWELVRKK